MLRALEAGAADAVAGDVSIREVVLRTGSIVRRLAVTSGTGAHADFAVGPIRLEPASRRVWIKDREVMLTKIEFDVLAVLSAAPGVVVDRMVLLERVWGYTTGSTDTVTVHVRRLRSKVEDDPQHPTLIKTVRGTGYLLDVPTPSELLGSRVP